MRLLTPTGVIPLAALKASCLSRRRSVSASARAISAGPGSQINISHGGLSNVTTLNFSATAQASTGAAILTNGTLKGVDVITGAATGDQINTHLATLATLTNTLGGSFTASTLANNAYTIRGTYSSASGSFSASATGGDTLVEWNDATGGTGHTNAVVLVGYADSAATWVTAGVIKLG